MRKQLSHALSLSQQERERHADRLAKTESEKRGQTTGRDREKHVGEETERGVNQEQVNEL